MTENYDDALKITLKNIHLQFPDGGEEMEQAIQQAYDGYNAQIQEMNLRVQSFNLNTIADAWSDQLNEILPEMKGTLEEKLSKVLEIAKFEKPDVSTWTEKDMMSWLGLDNMEIDTSAFENIFKELSATAAMMSTDKKGEIAQNIAAVIPTMEEVMQVRGPISDEAYSSMVEEYTTTLENAVKNADFSQVSSVMSENIGNAVANTDMGKIITELNSIGTKSGLEAVNAFNTADYSGVSSSVGNGIGSAINNTDMSPIISAINLVKSNTDDKINSSFSAGITTRMPVNVMLDYNVVNPTKTFSLTGDGATGSASIEVSAHANGGFVGNKQLSWVGEEGPEAIIPLVPGRRNRALTLFKQVGEILGIDKNANGGIIQSNQLSANYISSDNNLYSLNKALADTDYKIYNTALKNAPISYNDSTDNTSNDITTVQEPVSVTPSEQTGNNNIKIDIQVSPEFVINNSSGQKEEDIVAIIKKSINTMADELSGSIAERLQAVFSNMPIVGE